MAALARTYGVFYHWERVCQSVDADLARLAEGSFITSPDNPWRAFFYITDAMREVVIARASNHYRGISR